MGGYGSGRPAKRGVIEQRWRLDVRTCARHGWLRPGAAGTLSWSQDGEESGSASYRALEWLLELRYAIVSDEDERAPMVTSPYYYSGSADKSKTFQNGDTLVGGTLSSVPMLMFQPGYAADTKFLGGQPYVGLGWGPAYNRTSVDITLSQPALERTRTDSITGGADLYPYASLAWASGNDNWMAYLTASKAMQSSGRSAFRWVAPGNRCADYLL